MNVNGAPILIGAPLSCAPCPINGKDRRSVLDNEENVDNEDADNEENGSTHGWTKVMHEQVRKRHTSLAHADDGSGGHIGPSRAIRSRRT
jgi:hypothetical protein